jgi:hypothetical protein
MLDGAGGCGRHAGGLVAVAFAQVAGGAPVRVRLPQPVGQHHRGVDAFVLHAFPGQLQAGESHVQAGGQPLDDFDRLRVHTGHRVQRGFAVLTLDTAHPGGTEKHVP